MLLLLFSTLLVEMLSRLNLEATSSSSTAADAYEGGFLSDCVEPVAVDEGQAVLLAELSVDAAPAVLDVLCWFK